MIEITSFQSGNSQERSQGYDYVHELNESELEFEFSDFSQEDQEENSLNQDRMAGSPIAYRLRKSYYSLTEAGPVPHFRGKSF